MTGTMSALVTGGGPTWTLTEVPAPTPGPGEVLVRAAAVAVNNADLGIIDGADPGAGGSGEQAVAGFEVAGEVVALGEGVDQVAVGDQVMASTGAAFAELVLVDQRYVMPRPDGLAPEVGCALPTGLLTEHGALAAAGLESGLDGRSVLITGASTAIGLIGVQVVRALGAGQVIGTTRSDDKADLLREVGVDTVVVTSEQELTEAVLAATEGRGVDLVLDHVAGQTFADCLPATAEDGQVVNIGRVGGPASTIDIDALSFRHLTVHGVSFGAREDEMARVIAGVREHLLPAVADGRIRPVVAESVPWTEHERVVQVMREGSARGKLVLTLG